MQDIQLDHDEQITLTSYRHWINLVPPIVSSAILFAAAVAVSYLSGRHAGTLDGKLVPPVIITGVVTLLVVLPILITALAWWVYRHNRLILTNKHIFKLEQDGLFARRVSQLTLGEVEDVSGTRRGLIETLLNVGNVEVQTAGAQEEFIFIQMPNPAKLAHAMSKARDEFGSAGPAPAPPASPLPASPAAPAPVPQASPLQTPPAVPTMPPAAQVPTVPPPAPVVSSPIEVPAVDAEPTTTADFGDHEEPATPTPAPTPQPPAPPSPPAEQPAPIAPPTSAEISEHQTVRIPPPEPPAS